MTLHELIMLFSVIFVIYVADCKQYFFQGKLLGKEAS
jgi:hypothetical protein